MTPTPQQLQAAADLLGVNPDDLLVVDPQAAAAGEAYMAARDEQQAFARSMQLAQQAADAVQEGELTEAGGSDGPPKGR
jgi:hypothetical protein